MAIFPHYKVQPHKQKRHDFWVTNISNTIVSVPDLGIEIPPRASVNLLDARHYQFKLEMLEKSASIGDIKKRPNKLFVRTVPPIISTPYRMEVDHTSPHPVRQRPNIKFEPEYYEELELSDEEYLNETSTDDLDTPPQSKSQKKSKE